MNAEPKTPWSSPDDRDLEAELVARAGGWEAYEAFQAWRPYRPPHPVEPPDDDDEDEPLTPWSDGATPLAAALNRRARALGTFTPSRRQLLAGYTHPAEIDEHGRAWPAVRVEGQVERALTELGAGVTLTTLTDRLGVPPEDPDLLAVLFPGEAIELPAEAANGLDLDAYRRVKARYCGLTFAELPFGRLVRTGHWRKRADDDQPDPQEGDARDQYRP
jgi:hypothetical protein